MILAICGHPDSTFPGNYRMNEGGGEIRVKNNKFRAPFDEKCPLV